MFGLALCGWTALRVLPAEPLNAVVHFDRTNGMFRPLHGVNKGPQALGGLIDLGEKYRELGIPFIRLHDCQWPYPDVVDIHAIFRNPEADPEKPESYDFALTDEYLTAAQRTGARIVYRLGESIEHGAVKRFVHPPKDAQRWAAIARGIIRHYNEGWAGGFRYGIDYFEIWNEPENRPAMWTGTEEEFLRFYGIASRAIKAAYPNLKVGGPAFGYSGRIAQGEFQPSEFVQRFLAHCQTEKAPLDFFSWHCYTADTGELVARVNGVRALLDRSGFATAESHLNEWNYLPDNSWGAFTKTATPALRRQFFERASGMEGAAFVTGALMRFQDAPLDLACLFHGELGTFGIFDEFGGETRTFQGIRLFHQFLANSRVRAEIEGGASPDSVLLAGRDGTRAFILITHSGASEQTLKLNLRGLGLTGEAPSRLYTLSEDGFVESKLAGPTLSLRLPRLGVLLWEFAR